MFQTIRLWNERHDPQGKQRRISIMVPVNQRSLEHDVLPAANVVGLSFCCRRVSACNDPDRLLQSIHQEYEMNRLMQVPTVILRVWRSIRWIPFAFNAIVRWGKVFTTAVLSNVGNPWHAVLNEYPTDSDGHPIFGNLTLTNVDSASPLPQRTHAAFTTWNTNDQLRISLRADSRYFSRSQAQSLLDLFADRLLALIDADEVVQETRTAA